MQRRAFIVSIARTRIAPRGGLHRNKSIDELAAPVLHALGQSLVRAKVHRAWPDAVILGNAMAGGGNSARLCALAVFDERIPAMTIDTQCCSGLDAIAYAAYLIRSGDGEAVIAGGVESFSQAPQRFRKTQEGFEYYSQARFTPWPDCDPPVLLAAQEFAESHQITRREQTAWAVRSHERAIFSFPDSEQRDPLARSITERFADRLPALVRDNPYSITALTVAPEADAAAAVLVVSEKLSRRFPFAIEVLESSRVGCPPRTPALGGLAAAQEVLRQASARIRDRISVVELMESFAAQAIQNHRALGFSDAMVNTHGGLLSAGHPIGASGAVLVGNLVGRLLRESSGAAGLALVPAAGGLGSAMLCRKS